MPPTCSIRERKTTGEKRESKPRMGSTPVRKTLEETGFSDKYTYNDYHGFRPLINEVVS
jgi:hypothetical protein